MTIFDTDAQRDLVEFTRTQVKNGSYTNMEWVFSSLLAYLDYIDQLEAFINKGDRITALAEQTISELEQQLKAKDEEINRMAKAWEEQIKKNPDFGQIL